MQTDEHANIEEGLEGLNSSKNHFGLAYIKRMNTKDMASPNNYRGGGAMGRPALQETTGTGLGTYPRLPNCPPDA